MSKRPAHVPSSRSGSVIVTSPDRCDHLVDEGVFATSPTGRYPARCGAVVVSAALTEGPGRPCPLCAPRPSTPAQRRARRFRCRGRERRDG